MSLVGRLAHRGRGGSASLPVSLAVCQTDPATAVCLTPPAGSVTTQIAANATPTFGVFVGGVGRDPLSTRRRTGSSCASWTPAP